MSEHTRTPWKHELMPYRQTIYGPNGIIAEVIQGDLSKKEVQALTIFIVEACNSHDALVAENEQRRRAMADIVRALGDGVGGLSSEEIAPKIDALVADNARLRKALNEIDDMDFDVEIRELADAMAEHARAALAKEKEPT